MRFLRDFAGAVALGTFALACSATDGTPSTALTAPATEVRPTTPLTRWDVEHDLALVLRRATTDAFEVDRNPRFELVLANRSTTTTYPVVLPNDGSEPGWREPHLWYSIEVRTSARNQWHSPPERKLGRCGMFAEDWASDVVTIAPGQKIALPWSDFHPHWDLDGATHVRVVAHYAYGDHAKDLRKVPPSLHAMPAYALASDPMELAVETPMALELRLKGPLPTTTGRPLATAVEVFALNRSREPLPFATADGGARLRLEVEATDADGATRTHLIDAAVSTGDAKERLAPGARRAVLGAATITDWSALPASSRPKRVRAVLNVWWYIDEPKDQSDDRTARSAWVDVP